MATHRRGLRPSQWPVRDLLGPDGDRGRLWDARIGAALAGLLACGAAVTVVLTSGDTASSDASSGTPQPRKPQNEAPQNEAPQNEASQPEPWALPATPSVPAPAVPPAALPPAPAAPAVVLPNITEAIKSAPVATSPRPVRIILRRVVILSTSFSSPTVAWIEKVQEPPHSARNRCPTYAQLPVLVRFRDYGS